MLSAEAIALLVLCSLSTIWLGWTISNKQTCDINIEANSKQRFITRATRKDVELLYLRLLFLNESNTNSFSFNEDISVIYDPLRWVWANSEQGKAILSLPYDYKILSCTTLSRETDSVKLELITQPPGCFGRQNSQHQLTYVINILKETAKALSPNSFVCHRFVKDIIRSVKIIYQNTLASGLPTIQYRCCSANKQDGGCNMVIVPNTALSFILRVIWLVSCFVAFFTPLLIKYLPGDSNETAMGLFDSADKTSIYVLNCPGGLSVESSVTNLQSANSHDAINEDGYINLNTSTPLTGQFLSKACVPSFLKVRPRLFRFLLFSITIPAVLIIALLSYSLLLKAEVELQKQTEIKTDFLQMCLNPDQFLLSRIAAYIVSCLMLCAPANISNVLDESLILIGDLQHESSCCFICTAMKHTANRELTGIQLLYSNMCRHLKYLLCSGFWKVSFSISSFPSRWLLRFLKKGESLPVTELWQLEQTSGDDVCSCWHVVSITLWLIFLPIWVIAFIFAICVIIFLMIPIGYFLACTCFVPLVFLTQKFGNSMFTWLVFLVCFLINILAACFLIEMITFSWNFVLKLIGFTLMGLVVGIDYYMPYLVYALAIFFYFQNIGNNLSDKYLKLKVLLFEECEKQQQELDKQEVDVPVLFIKNKKTEMPMIPKELFEIVCNKYLPLKKTVASSIFTLVMIILFLTFAFASVMAFGKWAKLASLSEAIVTALISTLPKLLRNTGKHAGRSLLKEKIQLYSLKITVSQFARKQTN